MDEPVPNSMPEAGGDQPLARKDRTAPAATDYLEGQGKTTIAPEVLMAIARLTALDTPGVSRMSAAPGATNRLRRGAADGVLLDIEDDYVTADLYLVMKKDVNLREISRNVQHNITRAISEMVGMHVGRINVHIEDIDFPDQPEVGT
jgi:uncharacterized alkaline shock family protein YloU